MFNPELWPPWASPSQDNGAATREYVSSQSFTNFPQNTTRTIRKSKKLRPPSNCENEYQLSFCMDLDIPWYTRGDQRPSICLSKNNMVNAWKWSLFIKIGKFRMLRPTKCQLQKLRFTSESLVFALFGEPDNHGIPLILGASWGASKRIYVLEFLLISMN